MDPYRALVTGGAGFIGSTLVDRLLAEGHTVDVVDNLSTGSLSNLAEARANSSGRLHFHQLDVRSPDLVELMGRRQPDVVFHLAAQADVRVSVADPVLDADVNVLGSLRALEGARAAGARKVVFASSGGTIYGDVEQLPIKESQPQQASLAVWRGQEGGGGLPVRLPGAARARVHGAGAGQRLRASPGLARRGRCGRHLRRPLALR